MSLAEQLREHRKRADLSLEEVAAKAGISKTYLWELEKDQEGVKKPSADVLLRIANALSVTMAVLLELPTVKTKQTPVEIPAVLLQLRDRVQAAEGNALSDQDLRDLAAMRFRGGQPRTVEEWYQLYSTLMNTTRRKKP
jgi:transcriptional regulator with XRE-family HTH domain